MDKKEEEAMSLLMQFGQYTKLLKQRLVEKNFLLEEDLEKLEGQVSMDNSGEIFQLLVFVASSQLDGFKKLKAAFKEAEQPEASELLEIVLKCMENSFFLSIAKTATSETFLQIMESVSEDTLLEATKILLERDLDFTRSNEAGLNIAHLVGDNFTIDGSLYHKWTAFMIPNGFRSVWKHLDLKQRSPLHVALANTSIHIQTLELIFSEQIIDINQEDNDGNTILSLAARTQADGVVKKIINLGGDVHKVNKMGTSLLHSAVQGGNVENVELIAGLGVDPNIQDKNGHTPIFWISTYNERQAENAIELTNILLMYGANLLIKSGKGLSITSITWKCNKLRAVWINLYLGDIVGLGVICDGCGQSDFSGPYFNCAQCPDYDLCESCFTLGQEHIQHIFTKVSAMDERETIRRLKFNSTGDLPNSLLCGGIEDDHFKTCNECLEELVPSNSAMVCLQCPDMYGTCTTCFQKQQFRRTCRSHVQAFISFDASVSRNVCYLQNS